MKLTDYQIQGAKDGLAILKKHNIVYLAWEVRLGKTATVLTIAKNFQNVLFVTKLKAISSIVSDFQKLGYTYDLEMINYESIHKVKRTDYDLIILDEAHRLGGYPKKPKSLVQLKKLKCDYHILLSGTPCPESWSQIYHQLDVSKYSPFANCKSFYHWFRKNNILKIKEPKATGYPSNDYSLSPINLQKQIEAQDYPEPLKKEIEKLLYDYQKTNEDWIINKVKPYMLTKTQQEAGFKSTITDKILTVKMKPITYQIANRLLKDNIVEGKSGVILADTGVKLQQKLHQIYSGTVKLEDGSSIILDTTKAEYIKEKFKGKTIGIFYKYKEEYNLIKEVFGDEITNDIQEHKENKMRLSHITKWHALS